MSNGYRDPFPGGKVQLGPDADHWPPSSAEVINEYELYILSPLPGTSIGVLWDCFTFTPVKGQIWDFTTYMDLSVWVNMTEEGNFYVSVLNISFWNNKTFSLSQVKLHIHKRSEHICLYFYPQSLNYTIHHYFPHEALKFIQTIQLYFFLPLPKLGSPQMLSIFPLYRS
jgi:hypothetical protein